jgi:hypothetical protein
MSIRRSLAVGLALCGLLGAAACEDKKAATKPAEGADSGAPKPNSRADKNIVDALRAVGSARASEGPPENGVYAPGAADALMKIGDPPKVVVGSKGAAPGVQLQSPVPGKGKKLEGKVEVGIMLGQGRALPTVEFALSLDSPGKPADPAAPPAPVELTAKVTGAKPAQEQLGQLPAEIAGALTKARGSKIKLEVLPNGFGRIAGVEPSKEFDPQLAILVRSGADTLAFAFLPYPTEPIGVGGYWMITSREPYEGLDTMVYRMFKVLDIKPDRVELEVNVKRYVAGGQLDLAGLPPNQLAEFSGNVSGRMEVMPSDTSQIHADLTDILAANLTPTDPAAAKGGQRLGLQLRMKTRLALGR